MLASADGQGKKLPCQEKAACQGGPGGRAKKKGKRVRVSAKKTYIGRDLDVVPRKENAFSPAERLYERGGKGSPHFAKGRLPDRRGETHCDQKSRRDRVSSRCKIGPRESKIKKKPNFLGKRRAAGSKRALITYEEEAAEGKKKQGESQSAKRPTPIGNSARMGGKVKGPSERNFVRGGPNASRKGGGEKKAACRVHDSEGKER